MKIEDLSAKEKNEIVKDFVAPSELKLIEMAKYISTQQMENFDDASMFHAWIKESAQPVTRKYYGELFLAMMAEKDAYIVETLKTNEEKDNE